MRRQTSVFSWQRSMIVAILGTLGVRPAGPLLTTPTVRLLTSSVDPGGTTDLAALTEATFDGYAPVALVTHGPVNTPNGDLALLGDADYVAGGAIADPGEVITGYMITDSAEPPTLLYGGGLFNEPVPIAEPGDALPLDVYLPLPVHAPTGQPE